MEGWLLPFSLPPFYLPSPHYSFFLPPLLSNPLPFPLLPPLLLSIQKLSSPSDSHGGDFTARVKNFFSSSPLKRRRSMSLNALLQKTSCECGGVRGRRGRGGRGGLRGREGERGRGEGTWGKGIGWWQIQRWWIKVEVSNSRDGIDWQICSHTI